MKEIKNVAIIGMGALGIMYGELLSKSLAHDHLVFLGNQKRIQKFNDQGVYCNKSKCDFKMIDPNQTDFKADLLIFAVKATALEDSIELAKQVVSEDTIIVSVLNGISSEEIIQAKLNKGIIIKSVAQGMDALKINNQLTYQNFGVICTGLSKDEKENKESLDSLIHFYDQVNLPYVLEEDIDYRLWAKWMLNVGVNQVVMVYEGTFDTVQKSGEARDLMIAAMDEVILIAQQTGINLSTKDRDTYVGIVDSLNPDGMPSMRQDGLAKRYSEVELFAGTVISKAKSLTCDVPVNKLLYDKVKKMEAHY